jgi:hypothetical protein
MMTNKRLIVFLFLLTIIMASCGSHETGEEVEDDVLIEEEVAKPTKRTQHSYGGWYCPDNITGFPPVDIQNIDELKVVNGRLPTREETRKGLALMYIDTAEEKDARPLDITLPKLARYHSQYSEKEEVIIIIQASIIGNDTIVGFRYPNGGNGSAWFDEITFLSEEEVQEIGSTQFVFVETKIQASKEEVWRSITGTDYAVRLGMMFGKPGLFSSDWNNRTNEKLSYDTENDKAVGILSHLFGNIYLQIDYATNGHNSVEKMLILDDENGTSSRIQLVIGPFSKDFDQHNEEWTQWIMQLKHRSETAPQD